MIHYYRAGGKAPDELILKELEKTWQDSLQSGRSERFLIDLFDATSRYPAMPLKEGLKEKIHNKYSLGTMALRKAKSSLFFDNRNFDLLSSIEKEFPLQVKFGALDSLYSGWGLAEFRAGNLERGEAMLNKIQNKRMQEELYNKAAYAFMFSGKNLDKAEIYAQKAVDMSAQSSRKFDQIDQLYTLAQVQYYRKNLSAAIGTLEKAIALRGEEIDAVIIHVYLKYLMEAGEYEKAYNGALKYLKYSSGFVPIKKIFLESYAKVKGTPAEAEAYYDRLTNETKLQPPPPWGKVDIKSADFMLKDLDGKQFKLSDHLGKTVVLYFFKTRFGSEYRYEMVTKFIEVASSLESRKDVLFVGIDRSAVYDSNRIYLDEEQRIERVKQLMKGATSNLKVLLDEAINDPQKQDFHYKVSRLYSLASPGLFYVIDGKGILRYKYYFDGSSGIAGLTLLRALNAVK
ncbi:MAG: redoxin domain-containing protein [Sphingobacteriales bacterium]|nr:MAG: redoxin domain-containing protein [Sphingobacteriales bacterium]